MPKQQIEHIVLLMLENRSLDNILGWLYENDSPNLNIPPLKKGERAYEGLQGVDLKDFTNQAGELSSPPIRGASGMTIPSISPGETFNQVHTQLFNKEPDIPSSTPSMNGYLKDYSKIVSESEYAKEISFYAPKIMESHTPVQMSVLNGLAKHYAVCDHWFSSIPSQTNPNRAFLLTGTSQGLADNGYLEQDPRAEVFENVVGMGIGDDRFQHKTIWNALEEAGMSDWQIYWETSFLPHKISKLLDIGDKDIEEALAAASDIASLTSDIIEALHLDVKHLSSSLADKLKKLAKILKELEAAIPYMKDLTSDELQSVYTYRLFPALKEQVQDIENHFAKIDTFHEHARAGKLPKFSFIEPIWSISETTVDRGVKQFFTQLGNDYHPPSNQNVGEAYVQSIYESLIANEQAWEKTLFIITFDEPVGAFDHVPPPTAVPPWGVDGKPDFDPPIGFDGKPKPLLQHDFQFNRYGGRVPCIVVSPYIQKGTVFRSPGEIPYDHTSLISTLLKIMGHEEKISEFGERTKQAPSFENIITLNEKRNDRKELDFLNIKHKANDPLKYYDRFYLKNQNGDYLTQSQMAAKVIDIGLPGKLAKLNYDLGLSAYFPTLDSGDKVILFMQKSEDRPNPKQISSNDWVKIASTESSLNSDIVLGAWDDSHDCYYYDDYLSGTNNDKQIWSIQKQDGSSGGLKFGDQVYLVNKHFQNQRLSRDSRLMQGKWISTQEKGDYWTLEPITD
ncbi:alkaline phosphatase family protein [Pseudomonadota bacterium]